MRRTPGPAGNKLYYLYGLERAGRLAGLRFFGRHDWYREGAEELVAIRTTTGAWQDAHGPIISTCFALLFLAKGRAPVLVNKLRHGPRGDWNNDADDIRNLVGVVSRDWKNLLTWQVVDPDVATVEDLLQAPIVYFNGHRAPEFGEQGKKNLRDYVEQGGFILADACCGRGEFDQGFRALMTEIFPEPGSELHPLGEDHAIWRSKHVLDPGSHPLWGIELRLPDRGRLLARRPLLLLEPGGERSPSNPAVPAGDQAGPEHHRLCDRPRDARRQAAVHEVKDFKGDAPRRGALRIAKLKHGGEWNIAPRAIPSLMDVLRKPPLNFDVVLNQKDLEARDPSLVNYPLIYLHGRLGVRLEQDDLPRLRRHLEPGGGTIFADAACGSPAFDAAFRRFVAALLPDNPLVPIPHDDEIYTPKMGFDLPDVQYSPAAGDRPRLSPARGGPARRPLGGHLFEVRPGLRPGSPRADLNCKGLHARERPADRGQHRDLVDAPVIANPSLNRGSGNEM